jgi:hypothetical protein
MKRLLAFPLFLLSACAAPYEYSSRETATDEYEIVIKATGDNEIVALKKYFVSKGDELCHRRIFRLRGLREDMYFDPPAQQLTGQIECMNG